MKLSECLKKIKMDGEDIAEIRRLKLENKGNESAAVEAFIAGLDADLESARTQLVEQGFDVALQEPEAPAEPAATEPAPEEQAAMDIGDEAAAPVAPGEIEDFGEKIAGARKDLAAEWEKKLTAVQDDQLANEPLSKSWPEPKYDQLLESGMPAPDVAILRAMRDEIPTKPRGWKAKRWAEQVQSLRDFSAKLIAGDVNAEQIKAQVKESGSQRMMGGIVGRADLYEAVGHEKSLKGMSLTMNSYTLYKGEYHSPALILWQVEMPAKRTAMSHWPREIVSAKTREEAIEAFKTYHATMEAGGGRKGKAARETRFELYKSQDRKSVWIGKKIGRNAYIRLKEGFTDAKEARAYIAENQKDLEALLDQKRKIPSERRASNSPRVGADHRNGVDVNPDMFMSAFGFRGVQFGNYVEGPKRQADLNEAYDGLMDLAGVIGVPSRALSLNGTLGLAFGARGKGGKDPAAAHYETEHIVINLTKGSGAGSLAHEWWHGVDNYFSRERGEPIDFLSETTRRAREGVRPEVVASFQNVRDAISATSLEGRSRKIDARKSKDYWSQGREMTARTFEHYVITKLADAGGSNDYLANIVDQGTWDALMGTDEGSTYPYMTEQEVAGVVAAYDDLFNTIEVVETDTGLAMREQAEEFTGEPLFFSQLLRSVEGAKQAKAPAKDWKAIIGKLPGVKRVEIKWTGIEDWLDQQDGQVTRDDVAAFIRANQVEIVEVKLGDVENLVRLPEWESLTEYEAENTVMENVGAVDYQISEGEPVYPDDWADEAEMWLDEAREQLEARLDEDESADDITDEDVLEAAKEIAMQRYEPFDYEVTLYDREGNWPEYNGYYNDHDQTYLFADLPGAPDENIDRYEAIDLARRVQQAEVDRMTAEIMERAEAEGRDALGRTREQVAEQVAGVAERNQAIESVNQRRGYSAPARWASYTETGGKEYREILLTVPNLHEIGPNAPQPTPEQRTQWNEISKRVKQLQSATPLDQNAYNSAALEQHNLAAEIGYGANPFSFDTHFREPNIVAHARVTDRDTAEGGRALFVEEIQSDLASQWREVESPEVTARREEIDENILRMSGQMRGAAKDVHDAVLAQVRTEPVVYNAGSGTRAYFDREDLGGANGETLIQNILKGDNDLPLILGNPETREIWRENSELPVSRRHAVLTAIAKNDEAFAAARRFLDHKEQYEELVEESIRLGTRKTIDAGTPETPFMDPDHYTLMVKRLIREAAENGYDQLSWTPGYMQAERWGKAGQSVVETIAWETPKDTDLLTYEKGAKIVTLTMQGDRPEAMRVNANGEIVEGNDALVGKTLTQLLGGSVAKKIMAEGSGRESGQKITFADSGYAIAYDQHVRKAVEKFAKKFGARVQIDETLPDLKSNEGLPLGNFLNENVDPEDARRRLVEAGALEEDRSIRIREKAGSEIKSDRYYYAAAERSGFEKAGAAFADLIPSKPVWTVRMTPEMREAGRRAQPMFALGGDLGNGYFGAGHRLDWAREMDGYMVRAWSNDAQRAVMQGLRESFNAQMADFGLPQIPVDVAGSLDITNEDGSQQQMGGYYFEKAMVIAVDQNRMSSQEVFHHELLHALRSPSMWGRPYGLFTASEWKALERAAKEQPRSVRREKKSQYGGRGQEFVIEEIIADMLPAYLSGETKPKGMLGRAIRKIGDFISATKNWMRGHGFRSSNDYVEEIFGRIAAGEFGKRAAGMSPGRQASNHIIKFSREITPDAQAAVDQVREQKAAFDQMMAELEQGRGDAQTAFDQMKALTDAKGAMAAALAAQDGGVELSGRGSVNVAVTPSLAASGAWRVTYFNETGMLGHGEYGSKREALSEAITEGYDTPAPGKMREIRKGDKFKASLDEPPKFSLNMRRRTRSGQRQAHAASAMGGMPYIPDRRVWEELSASQTPIWARVSGAGGAIYDAVDKARIKIQDRFLPVMRAQQAVQRAAGKPLSPDQDAYAAELTFSGKVGRHLFEIDEEITKPIIRIIRETKGKLTIDEIDQWLTARHAEERNTRIASINQQMPDGGSGMMTAEARKILADAASGPYADHLRRVADLIDQLRERTLALRVDSGLMTQAEADLWRQQYDAYVPLKGFADTDMSEAFLDSTGVGRRFNTRGAEEKRALGRRSQAFSPLQGAITQAQEVAIRAEKNRVGQALYNLASQNPAPEMWEIKTVKQKRYFNKTTGLVETRPEDPRSLFMDPNEMAVKINGEEKRIIWNDYRLANAAGSVGADQMGWFIGIMSMSSRYFSSINTMLDPEFVIRNAFRDMTSAQINIRTFGKGEANEIAKAMVKNWPKAFLGAYRGQMYKADSEWSRHYREFEKAGAKVSFWRLEQPEAGQQDLLKRVKMASGNPLQKASKWVRWSTRDNPALGFIERTNLAVDNAIRLAAFVEARKRGWSEAEAAALSKDLTVNFNRRGEWGATINALYPFANAGIQGTQILVRAMTSKGMAKYAIGMVALGVILDLMNAGLSEEDDDGELAYDKIPTWKQEMSLTVMLGPDAGNAATFWLPYGYNVFPYMGTQIGKIARGVKTPGKAMADVGAAMFGSFSPINGGDFQSIITPTMLDPINEMAMNEDWLGRPIRPESPYADYGPNAYKFFGGATDASKMVASGLSRATGGTIAEPGLIDVSPEYLDHAFGFATGGAGRFVSRTGDTAAKLLTGREGEIETRNIPFYRSLQYETGTWLDRDRYYRFRDEVREGADAIDVYKEAREPIPDHVRRLAGLNDALKAAEKELRKLRAKRREIDAAENMPTAEQQRMRETLYDIEAERMLRFNKLFIDRMGPRGE